MGYFHSASSWKCSALAWPRGRERAGVGRQGSSRRMRGSSPSLDKSLSIRESTMGGLGDAACLWQVRCLLGSTHSQARAGGCSGPSGDTHTAPGQTSRCSFAELSEQQEGSTGGRPCTNTVPIPPRQLRKSPPPTPLFIESLYTSL